MKKGFFLQWVTCLLAVSCSIHELDLNEVSSGDVMFYASLESYSEPDTRVYVDQKVKMLWDAKDQVSIFNKSTLNQQFEFTGGTGDNAGGFKEVMIPPGPGTVIPFICAVYPYNSSTTINKEGVMTLTLPKEQAYRDGTFGIGANTMVSSTEDNMLKFKNVGGYLVLKFYGEGVSVSSIRLEGNNQELLAGNATLTPAVGKVPEITMSSTAETAVTLNCEVPVDLSANKEEATQFWLVVPPTVFTQGFTVTVTDPNGREFVVKTSAKLSVLRNGVLRIIPFEVVFDAAAPTYKKVSSITAGGTYLILDASETKVFEGAPDGSYESVSPRNNVIIDTDGTLAGYEFSVENVGNDYFLKFNDGKYLVCNYASNSATGLYYINAQSDVTYPFVLTSGDNGAFFFSTTHVLNGTVHKDQVLYFKSDPGSNVFKIGGSGTTIGVRLYLKDGKLDRGLSFNPKSVTCAMGSRPEKPVLSGSYETVTYSSSDNLIATVDASGNVTTVAPGTVTITASAQEDDEFNAGSASYTLRILKAAPGGWVDLEAFNLENTALFDYLNDANASYTDTNDGTFTVMNKYVSGKYLSIDRKDCPAPVVIEWNNAASSSTVISIFGNDSLTDPIWTQNATEGATSAEVFNLIPGLTYYYTVSENSAIWEKGYFSTTGRRRMIKVSDVEAKGHANNCRDLGGLEVMDKGEKKTIKYGYLFRGSNMDKTKDSEKSILVDFLHIGMDVDLRSGSSEPGSGEEGSRYCYQPFKTPLYDIGYIHPGFNSFDDLKNVDRVKSVLEAIFGTAKTGKATYFHCYVGADRTGYFAMLIEGLLGVSEKDCSIDYELTSFSDAVGKRYRTGDPEDYYFRKGIEYLRGKTGNSFQDKIEYYLVHEVGIDEGDIEEFKGIVLNASNL